MITAAAASDALTSLSWDDELALRRHEARGWLTAHPSLLLSSHMALVLSQTSFSEATIHRLRQHPIITEDVTADDTAPTAEFVEPIAAHSLEPPPATLLDAALSDSDLVPRRCTRSRKSGLADGQIPIDVVDAQSEPAPPAVLPPFL